MRTVVMRMVWPESRDVTVDQAYDGAHRRRHTDRPWVVLSMVSTVDGAIALDGVSGGLGNPTDQAVFLHTRRSADAVLVGAETVRAEGYRPLPAHQTMVVVSASGELGATGEALSAAGNTLVVSGDIGDIVRSIEGDVCSLEGGPSLNGQVLAAGLVDEICLTLSPRLVAGDASRLARGPAADPTTWALAHVCTADDGFLFLRYLRRTSPGD
jgi:riboflavin biosynthesis pyrimidine reductase